MCSSVFLLGSQLAMAQEAAFRPYFFIETGLGENTFDQAEFNGFNVKPNEFSLKLTTSYQLTPKWSVSISASSSNTYMDEKNSTDDESAYILTGINYNTALYSLVGGYDIALNDNWQVNFNAGAIIGKEKKEIYICPLPTSFLYFSHTCYSDKAISTSYDEATKASFIVGTSIIYNFAKNWGVKLAYKFSGYREGLRQSALLIQYRF